MGQTEKIKLKRIKVGETSKSNEINYRSRYRVKIDGEWYEGNFSKQWFGWCFDNYGQSGMQLNLIDEVYEIVRIKKEKPKSQMIKKSAEIEEPIIPSGDEHGS